VPSNSRAAPAAGAGDGLDEDINGAIETALRGWSTGDQAGSRLASHRAERQRPRRNSIAIAALVLIGAGGGALLALQWSATSDRAGVTVVASQGNRTASSSALPPAAAGAALIVPGAEAKPAPVQPAKPAAPAIATVASIAPAVDARALAPLPANVLTPAPVEAPTSAPKGPPAASATTSPASPALPSWYVEDDPGAFDTGAAHRAATAVPSPSPPPAVAPQPPALPRPATLRRMILTADVDVRSGPDATFASLGGLKAGMAVGVGECKLWCEVALSTGSGWVFYAFLSDPAAVAASTASR